VRQAAPLPEAAQGEPWQGVAQDGPWRAAGPVAAAVPQAGPLLQAARLSCAPGHVRRCWPRLRKRQEEMLQSVRDAEA
jgi:hypothetical protein